MQALMKLQYVKVYLLILLLGIGDAVSTKIALVTGKGSEINPIAVHIMNIFGASLGLVLMQTMFIVCLSLLYYFVNKYLNKNISRIVKATIFLAILIKFIIVINNFIVISYL
jgi:hypothetical protein